MSRTQKIKQQPPRESEKRDTAMTPERQKAEIAILVRRISELTERKPEKAAIVLTNWMKDRDLTGKKK